MKSSASSSSLLFRLSFALVLVALSAQLTLSKPSNSARKAYRQQQQEENQQLEVAASGKAENENDMTDAVGFNEASAMDPEFAKLTSDASDESPVGQLDEQADQAELKDQAEQSAFSPISAKSTDLSGLIADNNGEIIANQDDQDDQDVAASKISNAKIRVSAQDMQTAAGHHHGHHGHHSVKGWLEMGAHTGKKGSFGWHDKHPVGGKGRR